MRLRTKFILLFSGLSLAPLLFIGAIAYRNGQQAIRESLGLVFEQRAARTIESLDRETFALYRAAQGWLGLEVMQEVLTGDVDGRLSSFLIEQGKRQELMARALVVNRNGLVVASRRPEDLGRTLALTETVEPRHEADSCQDDTAPTKDTPTLSCHFPIAALFEEEQVIGTLVVTWDLGKLFERMQFDRGTESAYGELLLLRRDGVVVSAPGRWKDWMFKRNLAESGSRAAALALSGRKGFLEESLGNEASLIGYSHSTGASGWSALVAEEVHTAFAPVYRLRNIVLGVGALVSLFVVGLSVALARSATRSLLEMADGARKVASGDLETRLTARSRDELGSLAESFNQMIQDLRRQRDQLVDKQYVESILSNMIDGLLVVDTAGVVQTVNAAFLGLLRVSEAELLGRPAGSWFVEGEAALQELLIAPVLHGGSAREVELNLRAREGSPVPVIVSAGAIPGRDGAAAAIVCIATDITQRKLTEQALVLAREGAEAAAEAKAQFLATVTHEIRTPLNGIIGMTDLLVQTPLSMDQREFAETARRSGEALLAVVNDILDFSKGASGRLELEEIEFDPRACLEGVSDILALRADEKGLELVVLADHKLPSRVRGDPARLRQILLNLGSNAVKFTHHGEVVMRAGPDAERPGWLRFLVSDTGIGIAADRRERLFQPFSQLDASHTRKYGGTGLGLAIARELVELMHGEIGVSSVEGEGATFWFTVELPAVPAEAAAPARRGELLAGLRVLVVDDNATNRQVLREMLKAWGCGCGEASDAWEALDMLRVAAGTPREFELALIDFQMPEMDGGQLAAELKSDPRLKQLPLLLLTSVPDHGDAARVANMGFAAYLTKPIKQTVLYEAMCMVMAARRGTGGEKPRLALVTAHSIGEGSRARHRVLVIAETPVDQKVAVRLLEKAGCRCDVAGNGGDAVRAMASAAYDLVLMDCEMRELDAYAATREIRSKEDGGARLPIVGVSSEAILNRGRCLEAGMDEVLLKPLKAEDVRRALSLSQRAEREPGA